MNQEQTTIKAKMIIIGTNEQAKNYKDKRMLNFPSYLTQTNFNSGSGLMNRS